jgi:nucleoid-associated protein YgaU
VTKPEDRYETLDIKILSDGREVYASARPIKVQTDPLVDQVLTANERDRLDIIAHNVYGSAEEWWRIASANKKVNGSLHLRPGNKIVIPRS